MEMFMKRVTSILIMIIIAVSCSMSAAFAETDASQKRIEMNPETDNLNPDMQLLGEQSPKRAGSNVTKLEGISQDNVNSEAVFSKERNGVYFIQKNSGYEVLFFDLKTKTLSQVGTYTSQNAYYADENVICFVKMTREKVNDTTYQHKIHLTKIDPATGTKSESDMDAFTPEDNTYLSVTACGMDRKNRLYVSTSAGILYLFAANGRMLSQQKYTEGMKKIFGFDDTSGNFYYEGSYNWRYWGYDHDMASMMAGNVSSAGEITLPQNNLCILYQNYFYPHKETVRFLDDKYLSILSTFNSNQLAVMDSTKYSVDDYTDQETVIYAGDNSLGVSLLNISNTDAIKTQLYTASSNFVNNLDLSSEGTRCAISDDKKSLVVKSDAKTLTEYDLKDTSAKIKANASYEVYDFAMINGDCVALERDGNDFYIETISWKYPDDFNVDAPKSITVGESSKIVCSSDGSFLLDYEFESSDPDVISVDSRGRICAWSAGQAAITVKAPSLGVTRTVTITAKDSTLSGSDFSISYTDASGKESNNIHLPYTSGYYGNTINSAITQHNGDFVRVEYIDKKVIAETYDSEFNLKSTKEIDAELSIFGGFFSGSDAYYLAFGQTNKSESDETEVFRFVKYDKNWNRLGACSIKGANTYIPFDAGSLDMCEQNGVLFVHTCHEMYESSDGLHHQANCTFKVKENDMTLIDSYTDVMNLSYGYVSHSFNQKAAVDGELLYRADLGDANPRGIALSGTKLDDAINNPLLYGSVVSIPGSYGNNYTGFALGGLELSEDCYVIAGCGIKEASNRTRNIFISSSFKDHWTANATWLTSYEEGAKVSVGTPKLVKLNANQFMLLWEERNTENDSYQTKMVLIGSDGSQISKIRSMPVALSECEPIVDSRGNVIWYYTENSTPKFVKINPFRLDKAENDVLELKDISLCNISLQKTYYTYTGKAQTPSVTVTRFGKALEEGVDFVVEYSNNVKAGTATATVKGIGKYTGQVKRTYTIDKAIQWISCSASKYSIEVGDTAVVTASAYEDAEITFESSDKSIATIDADGTIHALKEGSVTINIQAAETENYDAGTARITINSSRDVHTMEDIDVVYADESNEKATVTRRCKICGKEEKTSFTTINKISYVFYWSGSVGSSYISDEQSEGDAYSVSLGGWTPSDAENKELTLKSSNEDVMKIDGMNFEFVGAGEVTLTIYVKYRPSVKITKTFKVSHVYEGEGTVMSESTCSSHGVISYKCSVCGKTYQEELPLDEEKHTIVTDKAESPTCTQDGKTEGSHCSSCGKVLKRQEVIPATGHDWDDGVESTSSSCANAGVITYECRRCHVTRTEVTDSEGHTPGSPVKEDDIPATCTTDGSYNTVIRCTVCHAIISSVTTTVNKLGHDYKAVEGTSKAVTCTEDGKEADRECSHCHDVVKGAVIKTSGHIFDKGKVTKEPTRSETGEKTFTCTICGIKRIEILDKLSADPEDEMGNDGTAFGEGASQEAVEAAIAKMRSDADPAGTTFGTLQAKSTKQSKKSVTIVWKKTKKAKKYVIYGNVCGKTNKMQKQKTVTAGKAAFSKIKGKNNKTVKIKKGTYYKFMVVAFDANNKVVSASKIVHVATKGGKIGNDKAVKTKAKKNKVTLKAGKTYKLVAKAVPQNKKLKVKKHRAIAYETSNPGVAKVSKKGVVTAKAAGACYVYAYAQDGVSQRIKVTVK